MQEESLNKKEPELGRFEKFSVCHIAKQEKACSEWSTKGVAKQPFHKEIMGVNRDLISLFSGRQEYRWGYTSKDAASLK